MSLKVPSQSGQLILVVLAASSAAYARGIIAPLQEAIRFTLDLSDMQIATIQGPAVALPLLAAAVPLGAMVDRASRRFVLIVFGATSLLGTLLTALAWDFASLFLFRCVVGLAIAGSSTAAFAFLGDLYPADKRGRANMIVVIGQFAGLAMAYALGGNLLVPIADQPAAWRYLIAVLAIPIFVATVLQLRLPQTFAPSIPGKTTWGSYAELLDHRAQIVPILIGLAASEVGLGASLVWAAPTLSRGLGLSPGRIGVIVSSVVIASGIVGSFSGGYLIDLAQRKGGPRRAVRVLASIALIMIPSSIFGVARTATFFVPLFFLYMTLTSAALVAGITILSVVTPAHLRGRCLSTAAAVNVLFGVAAAPMSVTFVSMVFLSTGGLGQALAVVCLSSAVVSFLTLTSRVRAYPLFVSLQEQKLSLELR